MDSSTLTQTVVETLIRIATVLVVAGVVYTTRKGINKLATGLQNITQAITDLNTSFSSEIAAITAALQNANSGGVSEADAAGIVTQLKDLQTRIDTETAALTTAPAPTPVP